MQKMQPSLNALRAFEAAARHLSLARAADELRVTPSALSHQIRVLEQHLEQQLFERRSRSIALTRAGKLLYPGLQTGFAQIEEAVTSLAAERNPRILVISTPPGLTARWLVPRIYRFSTDHPDIDLRVSSTLGYADFRTDGIEVAVRNMSKVSAQASELHAEKLVDLMLTPVCSPQIVKKYGGIKSLEALKRIPMVHVESLTGHADLPNWSDWLEVAGLTDIDQSRGLRFNTAEHALDAAVEGAGILLAQTILAYDDLRTGRLVMPFDLVLPTKRAYYFVCPTRDVDREPVKAFRDWMFREVAELRMPSSMQSKKVSRLRN